VRWCADGDFLGPAFPASRVQHICTVSLSVGFLVCYCECLVSEQEFLTDGTTTEESSHKKFNSRPGVWKVVMMIMYISYDGYIYLVNRITDLRDQRRCPIIVR